mmetsp:Transcript_11584/g.49422  ORF Transcript_11584/g.49422 Transcript_11584/m.49422 type:complete len:323 (+) Transcript_11584:1869-2837(+)
MTRAQCAHSAAACDGSDAKHACASTNASHRRKQAFVTCELFFPKPCVTTNASKFEEKKTKTERCERAADARAAPRNASRAATARASPNGCFMSSPLDAHWTSASPAAVNTRRTYVSSAASSATPSAARHRDSVTKRWISGAKFNALSLEKDSACAAASATAAQLGEATHARQSARLRVSAGRSIFAATLCALSSPGNAVSATSATRINASAAATPPPASEKGDGRLEVASRAAPPRRRQPPIRSARGPGPVRLQRKRRVRFRAYARNARLRSQARARTQSPPRCRCARGACRASRLCLCSRNRAGSSTQTGSCLERARRRFS